MSLDFITWLVIMKREPGRRLRAKFVNEMSDEAKTRAFNFLQKYLNTAKRDSKSANDKDVEKKSSKDVAKKDDDWLTK